MARFGGAWVALAMVACGGPRSSEDTAQVCVGALEEPGTEDTGLIEVDDGQSLELTAIASAGCHTEDLAVSCDVALDGDRLAVSTETTWVDTEPLSMNCEDILFQARATCATPALPAGSYTLAYAGGTLAFDVPGSVGRSCLDGAR